MIAVLDFGSQFTHLITRRIRELGVQAKIFDFDISPQELEKENVTGIIFSGGPNSVYDKESPRSKKSLLEMDVPILGVCYGHQLITYQLDGEVKPGKASEYGEETLNLSKIPDLFKGTPKVQVVWFSHGDDVLKAPKDFEVFGTTRNSKVAAFKHKTKPIYGIQFHPEVAHTKYGMQILKNFLFDICKVKKDWKVTDVKSSLIASLKKQIGEKNVIIGVSGGVDSLVASALLHQALGNQLYCVFIDTGLMRQNEGDEVEALYKKMNFAHFQRVNAKEAFMKAIAGEADPEEKRKKFAKAYFQVFTDVADTLKKTKHITYLAQGTIYPDRIEAAKASKMAHVIKTHHNLSVPEKLGLEIVEPLAEFYKDEVRTLGKSLGIPAPALSRHPFPGPGLAIRVLGAVDEEKIEIVRQADAIFIETLRETGYYDKTWQALAALLPVRAVGVMGDGRTYAYIIALRAITSNDAMTADWARLPDTLLNTVAKRITNEVKGVNRVLYDISQKPPATIEYE